jgi:hypothetical protein
MTFKTIISHTIMMTMTVLLLVSVSLVHGQDVCVAGKWKTNTAGPMYLSYRGTSTTSVKGNYTSTGAGKIDGTMTNNVLDGYWTNKVSAKRCTYTRNGSYYWGKVTLNFQETRFSGKWGYCTDTPKYTLSGSRVGAYNKLTNGVYWSARDLDDCKFLGNHQFLLLATADKNMKFNGVLPIAADTVCGTSYFFTVGGFKTDNYILIEKINESSDIKSVHEYTNPAQHVGWLSTDYDLEIHSVPPPSGSTVTSLIKKVMELATNYLKKDINTLPSYKLKDENCAAWINTLLKVAGLNETIRETLGEFDGFDWGEEDYIPDHFFK